MIQTNKQHIVHYNRYFLGPQVNFTPVICNILVLSIQYLVSSIFKVMLAESSLFSLKAIYVLDCILS